MTTPPGPFMARYRQGPPMHFPGLGWLPGPPHSLIPLDGSAVLYVVDDAHAGETSEHRNRTLVLISTVQALIWLAASQQAVLQPPTPEPAPPSPAARWLNKVDAAAALGISPWTLEEVRKGAPLDLPGGPHAGGAGKRRVQWRYPADVDVLTAWWAAATRVAPVAPPKRPQRPGKRAPTRKKPTSRRSMLAILEEERG